MYTSQPITALLGRKAELPLAERCTFSSQNRTRSGTLRKIFKKDLWLVSRYNLQERRCGVEDVCEEPLFSDIDEAMFDIKTVKALIALHDNYEPLVSEEEEVTRYGHFFVAEWQNISCTEPSDQSLGDYRNYVLRYKTVYVLVKLIKLPMKMSLN